jgi:hypothetical protein
MQKHEHPDPLLNVATTKHLSDLSSVYRDILVIKMNPHPLIVGVYPYRSIENSDPLLNVVTTKCQQRVHAW